MKRPSPKKLTKFRQTPLLKFPRALDQRLTELLDRQDREGKLSAKERGEAEALVEVAEFCTLLKLTTANSFGRK